MIEPPKNLLPGLSFGARKSVLNGFLRKLPTAEIVALVGADFGETVTGEAIDRARLLCLGKIEKYLSDRDEIVLLSSLNTAPIEQSVIAVAIEQQAYICYQVGKKIAEDLAQLEQSPDSDKKEKHFNELMARSGWLATMSANTVRSQVMLGKYAIELPHRREQLYGKKEALKSEITEEFVLEMERLLGVLPYDESFEPQPINNASADQTTL